MKKVNKPGSAAKPAPKRPTQKKLMARRARPKTGQGGAGLAEVVAQLAMSAEKLAQAVDRLAKVTTRLSVTEPARHERLDRPGQPPADSTTPQPESEAAAAAEGEQSSTGQVHGVGQGEMPTTDS
jgi:hypothetical protein